MRRPAAAFVLIFLPATLVAQEVTRESRAQRFIENCERGWGGRDRDNFCEVRDLTMRAPATRLMVDGRDNGGVTVYGWDRNEVRVQAMIQAWGDSKSEAQSTARSITVSTDGDRVRADGPQSRRDRSWSVSYVIYAPVRTNLDVETHNGGITVEGIEGLLQLEAHNGGVSLSEVAGDVRAQTTNGAVSARLSGASWKGEGLIMTTTNGSVNLEIPRGYNAELETGTVNGGINFDFPITVRGDIGRRIVTRLGSGGPRLRAHTTNGPVRIREAR